MGLNAVIPAGIFAAIGAWFLRQSGQAQASPVTAGEGVDHDTDYSFPSVAPSTYALPTTRPLTKEEVYKLAVNTVRAFLFDVSPLELVVTASIESSFRPWVSRAEKRRDGTTWDTSYGLMQTLLGTAKEMYGRGYTAAGFPTPDLLKKPEASMYFGAAYKDYLRRAYPGKNDEWHIRAYNGGPGFQTTQTGPVNTLVYFNKYAREKKALFGAA